MSPPSKCQGCARPGLQLSQPPHIRVLACLCQTVRATRGFQRYANTASAAARPGLHLVTFSSRRRFEILVLRVGDVLVAWREKKFPEETEPRRRKREKRIEWVTRGSVKFQRRSYSQEQDGMSHVDAEDCVTVSSCLAVREG